MTVKFKLYGCEHEMGMDKFIDLMTNLCKSVVNENKSWKQFCETEFQLIEAK